MKLYLAVAVLMLAFAALAEAQEEDTLSSITTKVQEAASDMTEKVKIAFDEMHNSDFAVKTRKWFSDRFESITDQFQKLAGNIGN